MSSFSICFVVFVKNVSLIKLGFMSDKLFEMVSSFKSRSKVVKKNVKQGLETFF